MIWIERGTCFIIAGHSARSWSNKDGYKGPWITDCCNSITWRWGTHLWFWLSSCKGILSYPILPYPILSYPILSYPILSYPILSYLILSYLILSYLILSYLILSYLISSHLILSLELMVPSKVSSHLISILLQASDKPAQDGKHLQNKSRWRGRIQCL